LVLVGSAMPWRLAQNNSDRTSDLDSGILTAHGLTLLARQLGVQQKLMGHSDIRTTMNFYGDAESAEMQKANGKIVEMAFSLQ
jgi:integrase